MRWIVRILGVLVLLAVVGIAALFLIPAENIARIAEQQFEDLTGRKMEITGGVSPSIYPRLGVTLEGVRVSNADWAGAEPMVQAGEINVGVGLMALIGGDIVVEAFEIASPVIRLERASDGQANWDFLTQLGSGDDAESDAGQSGSFSLPQGLITNGSISFEDAVSGQSHRVEALDAEVNLAAFDGAVQIALSGLAKGQQIGLAGQVDGLEQMLAGELRNISAHVEIGGNTVSFEGAAGLDPIQAQGALDLSLSDHPALFGLLDQSPPRIPEGLGQRVGLKSALTVTPEQRVSLRGAVIDLDQNRLTGDVDLSLGGAKPVVTAQLSGDRLDFSAMSTDDSAGDGAANAGAGGWSDARIDASGLSAVDGTFALRANAIDLGSIQLQRTDLKGALERARLVLTFNELGLFDGSVTGQFVVNNRNGLSVGGDMTAKGVAMQAVLRDFAGFERLRADAGLALKFLGVGETMNQIMNSLSGSGKMDVGAGEILGLDILGMVRNLDLAYQGEGARTVFDGISASFAMADGVLRNDDLALKAPLLTAEGAGTLDLGGQTIDYRLVPVALASEIDEGISVPVLVTGPWNNVKFRPDLKALLDRELEEEKAKLKAAAQAKEAELKAKAEAKVKEELGLRNQEGQSVEDAVKDKLEDKAKDALRSLFD